MLNIFYKLFLSPSWYKCDQGFYYWSGNHWENRLGPVTKRITGVRYMSEFEEYIR